MGAATVGREDIAIIGAGCRFPGHANSPSKLWEILRSPRQLAEPIPPDRFSVDGFYHKNNRYHGHTNVKEAYLLSGDNVHRRFDASFFGVHPAEAMCLDPQCRLLLETVYEALEAAGLPMENLRGSDTAVYTGQMVADYNQIIARDNDDNLGTYYASGTSNAMLSNRISYFFDWRGPSMTIDTACSSSLVALHQAVQQLRTGQSRVAIAAGANLIMDPKCFISLSKMSVLSPDARSKMWDADANGYARGEGIAAIVLKTLSAALEDGDSIECIIKETGLNQDGKTQGIFSPNHAAQTQLIRDCYSRAGLNLADPTHRPQFFECHGTGTLAGDKTEAQAISAAFFPPSAGDSAEAKADFERLVVGSIKTIIGHTEGTAGLAGVLKASLSLQNATITPNMLFNRLNPGITPFYKDLHVSTAVTPWPSNSTRRASVNSFGFGGTNGHAILESYIPNDSDQPSSRAIEPATVFTPFVFSAHSEKSLLLYLARLREHLGAHKDSIRGRDLAYTLHSRRSCFQVTTAIAASTIDELCDKIDAKLQDAQDGGGRSASNRVIRSKGANLEKPSYLGVFTGQGAQWAGMGSELLKSSVVARRIIEKLEARLAELPELDRPPWSLTEELLKESASSRIGEAALSQPLCTAVQILQVNLLRAAGIEFSAVVGHSSGEIAAAYAAGFISAEDAICIAYYRGLHTKLASGPDNKPGAMMAVGTSVEDAQELCDDPEFLGRVCIAAVNSPASITVSGDRDAVEQMKVIFDDEKKFARVLRVDKAYHSHHMNPCSEAYLQSLAALEIEVGPGSATTWFSSVHDGEDMSGNLELVKGTYWDTNMVSPVLFQQAVTSAYTTMGHFDLAIEVGPHPALQGPALQITQEISNQDLPYTCLFRRDTSAVASVAEGLGYVWAHLGNEAVNLGSYEKFLSPESSCRLVKGLPTYAWDHDEYWIESRHARAGRLRPGPVHELLGHMTPESNDQDMQWRHVLRPTEIPWLMGHRLQGQVIFPGAGYVVTALEAAKALCQRRRISASLIELINFDFGRALVFDDDDSSIEVIVSMADISQLGKDTLVANFRYHGADNKGSDTLNLLATSTVQISIGEPVEDALPSRAPKPTNLTTIRSEDFYSTSRDLEYQWEGPFTPLDKLERKLGAVVGVINTIEPSDLMIHPAVLDGAFQGLILAYTFPDDGQLWGTHVPSKIRRFSVNPSLCERETAKGNPLPFYSSHSPDVEEMIGNVDVYPSDPSISNAFIQVEDLKSAPLTRAGTQDDKEAFATIVWDVASPDPQLVNHVTDLVTPEQLQLDEYLERMAAFYLRKVDRELPADHPSRFSGPYTHLFQIVAEFSSSAKADSSLLSTPEWEHDTHEQLIFMGTKISGRIEVQLLREVGESLSDIMKGDRSGIQLNDEVMARFYEDAADLKIHNKCLAQTTKQLTHRYPHLDILEIGAGTGAATEAILGEIGASFSSYTSTNATGDLFEATKSKPWIASHLSKMIFKTLDISREPTEQGLVEQSYDVVVVSLALWATPSLDHALRNIRQLLKPGGHLLMLELLPTKSLAYNLIFGTSAERRRAVEEGRALPTAIPLAEWDAALRETGFSGCDAATQEVPDRGYIAHFAVLVSQALDDKVAFLRDPLSSSSKPFESEAPTRDLVILGGSTPEVLVRAQQTEILVSGHYEKVQLVRTISEMSCVELTSDTTVLSLAQLDGPIFPDLDQEQWVALRDMLMTAGTLLWVTQGRRIDKPYAGMMVGLMRSIIAEVPTLRYQTIDFESSLPDASTLAAALLRFQAESLWRQQDAINTTVETELVMDARGKLVIPRLVVNEEMNDRYNSLRRPLMKQFDHHAQRVHVAPAETNSGYALTQKPISSIEEDPMAVQLEVTRSLLSAIRVAEFGNMFAVLGRNKVSGDKMAALSIANSSITYPLRALSIGYDIPPGSESRFLALIALFLLASATLRGLKPRDIVLVHEPDLAFAAVLSREARKIGVRTVFVASRASGETEILGSEWINVHHWVPDRILSRRIPTGISVFLDFTIPTENNPIRGRIQSLLPMYCRQDNIQTILTAEAWMPPDSQLKNISGSLQKAVAYASSALEGEYHPEGDILPVIPSGSLLELDSSPAPYSIVDWTQQSSVPVLVRPIDTQITFPGDRTYWLAGLSGGLGLAICEWMSRHGAKYFVISSRNPQIDPVWVDEMKDFGVEVKILSCDVTVKSEVEATYQQICAAMPPISGVAQGSMVLDDTAIREMNLDNLLNCTRCKVEGSIHLNDMFQDNSLDFFVFFSSVVGVIGRPGQANYGAANMFMASLAEQRRRKGLAASVIHIGPVYGIGYATQRNNGYFTKAAFRSASLIPVSERDFYQLFAEAVVAGRPDPAVKSVELFNGVRRVSRHDPNRPVWEGEPLMSHFIKNPDGLLSVATDSQSRAPLKTQLAEARTRAQVHDIIQEAFFPKLYNVFQIEPSKVPKAVLAKTRLDEMGTDSLIAVEIRGWFMKTLEVNIPVLKILSGVPIGDLITMASESVPERLVPNLAVDSQVELKSNDTPKEAPDDDSDTSTSQQMYERSETPGSEITESNHSTATSYEAKPTANPPHEVEKVTSHPSHTIQKTFRLSFSQEMFWFVWAFLEDKTSLNHTALARISGRVRIPELQRAVRLLGQRHEILRTCFYEKEGQPIQAVMDTSLLDLEVRKINGEAEARNAVQELQDRHVYDLARGQTARVMLLSTSPDDHFFVAGLHPLIADGISFMGMLKGIQQYYTFPDDAHIFQTRQFFDFSEKQRLDYAAGRFEKELHFWKSEFAVLPPPLPVLTVSTAMSRPALIAYDNEQASLRVSADIKGKVQAVCRRFRITPFHFYLAVFRVLLLRYAPAGEGEDVVIGIGDANRTDDNMMDVIGPFVNLAPLRIRTQASASFSDLLQATRDNAYAALANSKVPFQVLLTELEAARSSSYTSLFQCFVNYRQGMLNMARWGPNDSLTLESVEIGISKMAYDITLEIVDYTDGDCLQTLVVRKDLYGQEEVQRLADSYERLLEAFVANPILTVEEPNLFGDGDVQEALKFSRGPTLSSQWPETLVHRIDEVARERAREVAVRHGKISRTYEELVSCANNIAATLHDFNVAAGSPVAVLLEPSPAWISALIGIMRAGAVYLPLDLSLPWARLATIVQDCQPSVIIVDEYSASHVDKLERPEMQVIVVSEVEQSSREPTSISASKDDPAVMLYTSGSTGTPKGIMLTHAGLRNWTEPIDQIYNIGAEVVLQQTSPAFDLSLIQIFTALCFGGTLCLVSRQQRGDAKAISRVIATQGVTFTGATPSEYTAWIQYCKKELRSSTNWKIAFLAGERVHVSLIGSFSSLDKTDLRLYNVYGPTETTFTSTRMRLPLDTSTGPIAVGSPLPNYSIYVVDNQFRPVPAGVQGEVYISGPGVGLGYLNRPELTAEKFLPNLFATAEDEAGGWKIMHRTGDLGRWRKDGALLIEGRVDTQVKLRGLRIDLGEVEHTILEAADGALSEVAVSVRRSSPEEPEFLVAHICGSEFAQEHIGAVQAQLRKKLPRYMQPAHIIPLDKMPKTNSAKVDRNLIAALPLPVVGGRDAEGEEVEEDRILTDTEANLKSVWNQILGPQHAITTKTDFFHAGGSSLLLLRLQARIKENFKVELPLVRLFESSTLGAMAHTIDHGVEESLGADVIDWDEETALSPTLINLISSRPPHERPRHNTKPRVVVLTGATGELGGALLESLVADPDVDLVHCIGVRNGENRTELTDLNQNKVIVHDGDLAQRRLGLSEDEAEAVFSEADAVVHNGADMSYLKTYASMRAMNLQSTKDLVEMVARYGVKGSVPFHYVSTVSVGNVVAEALRDTQDTQSSQSEFVFRPVSVAAWPPPAIVSHSDIAKTAHGYVASKWASEVFLEHLHERYPEFPVVIHRPSLIKRQSWGLEKDASNPGQSFVENVRQYASALGAVPTVLAKENTNSSVSGSLNVVPLEEVVKGVIEALAGLNSDETEKGVKFIHHIGDVEIPLNDVRKWITIQEGDENIQEIEVNDWIRRASELGMQPTMAALLEDIAAAEGQLVFPRLGQ